MQEQSFPVDFEEIKNFIVGRHLISHDMKTLIWKIVKKNVFPIFLFFAYLTTISGVMKFIPGLDSTKSSAI